MISLYKLDTKKKVRILILSTDDETLIQESGLLDGKLTVNTRICKPKNTGKVNATTAEEQAEVELLSIKERKLREGYFLTVEEAQNNIVLLPMLAVKADLSKLEYPVFVQPKADGMRCFGTSSKKMSRKNKEIETLDHIDLTFLSLDEQLDGEVYAHGQTFQDNMKLIKKYREGLTEAVKYHVYDLPSHPGVFSERYDALLRLTINRDNIIPMPTYTVQNEGELLQYHDKFLRKGYEGTMIRTNSTSYEFNKRSKSLMKLKDFIDEAYEIIDVVPSDRIPEQGVVVCRMDDGQIFNCGMKMSHKERELALINKQDFIGKTAEVRFFEFSDKGIPRFPVFYCTRDDV